MLKYFKIPYVNNGRDHSGCDCYGLVKLLSKELDGKKLPNYHYEDAQNPENGNIYLEELKKGKWVRCVAKKGAMVLLRIDGVANHAGYMIDDTKFLHITKKTGVAMASINDSMFKNRIIGFGEFCD